MFNYNFDKNRLEMTEPGKGAPLEEQLQRLVEVINKSLKGTKVSQKTVNLFMEYTMFAVIFSEKGGHPIGLQD